MTSIFSKARRSIFLGFGITVALLNRKATANTVQTEASEPKVKGASDNTLRGELGSKEGADLIGWQGSRLSSWLRTHVHVGEARFAGGVVVGDRARARQNAAAINAASRYLSEAGGGMLEFPGGGIIYVDGTLIIYSKVEWQGASSASTVIRQINPALPLVQSNDYLSLTGTGSPAGVNRCAVRRMTLEGDLNASGIPSGNTSQHGIQLYGYGFTLADDLHVRAFGGCGIITEWKTPGTAPDTGYLDGFVEARYDCLKVYNCGLSAMKIDGPHDAQWNRVVCFNNNLRDKSSLKANVWLTSKANPQYIDQLHAWGSSSGVVLMAEGAVKLTNSALEGGAISQMRIATGECEILGGELFAPGGANAKGIEFVSGPKTCIGYKIDTVIRGCNGGSIDFGSGVDAAVIDVRIYQTAGQVTLGTVPPTGVGNSVRLTVAGGKENRKSISRDYGVTCVNFSTSDAHGNGLEYSDHGGEGMIALPQRKSEPPATYKPKSGIVGCARENAFKFWQQSGNVGALMGESPDAVDPVDDLSFANYQLTTLAAARHDVVIKNFRDGLNGSPIFLLFPEGGAEITLATSGNIRSKSGRPITRTGLGLNRMLSFIKAKDGSYYEF